MAIMLLSFLVAELFISSSYAQSYSLQFFSPNTTSLFNVSNACASALSSNVACDPTLLNYAFTGYYSAIDESLMNTTLCTSSCASGLASYRSNVVNACANQASPWVNTPFTFAADFLGYYRNQTCIKSNNATGPYYCINQIAPWFNLTANANLTTYPTSQICSSCFTSYMRTLQSSAFSVYNSTVATTWAAIQSKCKESYPTAVPSPIVTIPVDNSTTSACTGTSYTIKSGDTCHSVSSAQKVSEGILQALNFIPQSCDQFPAVGSTLCLPKQCTIYTVQNNDSCVSIATAYNTSYTQIKAWNPNINNDCSNLATQLNQTNICLSPPGGAFVPTRPISGAPQGLTQIYASTVATPYPSPIATNSTRQCGKWYQVMQGDYCNLVSLNQSISLQLFEQINPQINSTCGNLLTGFYYCVQPTANWDSTNASSIAVAPPGPTASGTTNDCFDWYIVKSGDSCSVLESKDGATLQQLQAWNPVIDNNCDNIQPSTAYCVNGAASTTSPTVAPPGPTASGTTNQCFDWYIVKNGDTCSILEARDGATLKQLQGWNPVIDNNCDNIQISTAYCVNGASSTTSPTVAPPGPTASGTTNQCYDWYVVKNGDTCQALENKDGASLNQLRVWNPVIDSACDNIQLSTAYCVNGAASTSAAGHKRSAAAPTPAGSSFKASPRFASQAKRTAVPA